MYVAIEMIELCLGAVNMGGQQGRERMQENTGMKISREIGFGWVERKGKDIFSKMDIRPQSNMYVLQNNKKILQ